MGRVKVENLAGDVKINAGELKMVKGGLSPQPEPPDSWKYSMPAKFNYLKWTRPRII